MYRTKTENGYDIYFDSINPRAESEETFINRSGFSELLNTSKKEKITIFEVGTGIGRNLFYSYIKYLQVQHQQTDKQISFDTFLTQAVQRTLESLQTAINSIETDLPYVRYISCDHNLPQLKEVLELIAMLNDEHATSLLTKIWEKIHHSKRQPIHTFMFYPHFEVVIINSEAKYAIDNLKQNLELKKEELSIDCVFLDGFSPATNPSAWSEELLAKIIEHCHAESTVVSYSVAKMVLTRLQELGMTTIKCKSEYRKKHTLVATFLKNDGT